jgi:CxxC motif-containing protein (DUF1111 family)
VKKVLPFSAALFLWIACDSGSDKLPDDVLAGGATTVFVETSDAFATPAANLVGDRLEKHLDGDAAFERQFVTAPASVNSGLGPLFNNASCIGCHTRDGRGLESLLLRLSSGSGAQNTPVAVPGFGTQLQTRAVFGKMPEGIIQIHYTEIPGSFPDGELFSLRKPVYSVVDPYTALPQNILISPRFAPSVFGLGLLEAITETDILAHADPDDADQDGISGRPNYVWNQMTQMTDLGRFGWKANQPSLRQQSAGAYNGDMGITTSVFSLENCEDQTQCDTLTDDPELEDAILDATTFYVQTLGVPARRRYDEADVIQGDALFQQAGCVSCHVPRFKTGNLTAVPEVSNQTIFPYTDLLLHDMGPDLADGRPDFLADGQEWRTAPLWGLGLLEIVNGHTQLLHDGRARNIVEAILWHGGEAKASRNFFMQLSKTERDAIVAFLKSL